MEFHNLAGSPETAHLQRESDNHLLSSIDWSPPVDNQARQVSISDQAKNILPNVELHGDESSTCSKMVNGAIAGFSVGCAGAAVLGEGGAPPAAWLGSIAVGTVGGIIAGYEDSKHKPEK